MRSCPAFLDSACIFESKCCSSRTLPLSTRRSTITGGHCRLRPHYGIRRTCTIGRRRRQTMVADDGHAAGGGGAGGARRVGA